MRNRNAFFKQALIEDFTAASGSKGSIKGEREAANAAAAGNCHEGAPVVALNFNFIEIYRIKWQHPAVLCKRRCGKGVLWDFWGFFSCFFI